LEHRIHRIRHLDEFGRTNHSFFRAGQVRHRNRKRRQERRNRKLEQVHKAQVLKLHSHRLMCFRNFRSPGFQFG